MNGWAWFVLGFILGPITAGVALWYYFAKNGGPYR